ncbi:hypothetical protein [uncultured Cytophaga sp.]|uniref:hypothetical protein n=1 Tax=uncultured Cytophaga sp. TaxID=160238 RepID=UPI00261781B3|nr:hypothetical protein [uncultured Cytophaga sp.]
MKNLKPYKDDCFVVHKSAVDKKHAGDLKNRLLIINPLVQLQYDLYSDNFDKNTIGLITPSTTFSKSKDDLLTLYNYQSKVIRDVRENIKKLQIKTIISTCQNCTIDSANSLDHILPKADYPEYVVNPKNLFPCCTTCNSYKLDTIEDDSGQKFINLYLDTLPNTQYLFLDIFKDLDEDLNFKYYLNNINNSIPAVFFKVIENHYNRLRLFERFKLKSIEYVSELESKISAFRRRLTVEEIISDLTTAALEEKNAYGDNHWKCILELSLINSSLFMEKFK